MPPFCLVNKLAGIGHDVKKSSLSFPSLLCLYLCLASFYRLNVIPLIAYSNKHACQLDKTRTLLLYVAGTGKEYHRKLGRENEMFQSKVMEKRIERCRSLCSIDLILLVGTVIAYCSQWNDKPRWLQRLISGQYVLNRYRVRLRLSI